MFDRLKKELVREVVDIRDFMNQVIAISGCSEFQAMNLATNVDTSDRDVVIAYLAQGYSIERTTEIFVNTLDAVVWKVGYEWRDLLRTVFKIRKVKL